MSDKTLITVLVTVKKKTSQVAVECAEHEVPILKFIHGPDAIEIKERDYGTLEIPDSAEAELARLVAKYDDKQNRNVAAVFSDLDRLAQHVGLNTTYDPLALEQTGPEQSSQIDTTKAKRKQAAKDAQAKKNAPKAPAPAARVAPPAAAPAKVVAPAPTGTRQGSTAAK